jgi:tRNA(Ile)-lysidine synthase
VGLDRGAPETLIDRLLKQLPDAHHARWPVDGALELTLYRGRLALAATKPPSRHDDEGPAEEIVDLSRPGVHELPHWRGVFEVTRAGSGVPAALLKACRVVSRSGGEQWQAAPRSTPRSLKKQYQAAAIPASLRDGPLVYAGQQLVFVPGLGLDARVCRQPMARHSMLALRWCPAAPARGNKRALPSG